MTKKILVDTSALRPALGQSTKRHEEQFRNATADGHLWTSVYIRMEFIRRWVCDFIRLALEVDQFDSVDEALVYLEQDFSSRAVKGTVAVVATLLRENGAIQNRGTATEEIGRMAVGLLRHFDHVFKARIRNKCECQIGGRELKVDFDNLLEDLRDFYEQFRTPVLDCEVNSFLQFRKLHGRTRKLTTPDTIKESAVKELNKFDAQGTWITCSECRKIGDAVIALEQQNSWVLAHLDNAFNALCDALGKQHIQIPSVRAVENEARNTPTGQ